MSQHAWKRRFDAMAIGSFAAAGLADAATYLSPAALADLRTIADHDPDDPDAPPLPATPVPVPCTVLVDQDTEDFGDDLAPVSVHRTSVAVQRADFEPEQGGQVTVGATTYLLVQRVAGRGSDESLSRWWVQEVAGG